jgi:hypothetical protein
MMNEYKLPKEHSRLLSLPPELLCEVFTLVPFADRVICMAVCQGLRSYILEEGKLWEDIDFRKGKRPVTSTTVDRYIKYGLGSVKTAHLIWIEPAGLAECLDHLGETCITYLQLSHSLKWWSPLSFAALNAPGTYAKLERLHLRIDSTTEDAVLSLVQNMPNLFDLELHFYKCPLHSGLERETYPPCKLRRFTYYAKYCCISAHKFGFFLAVCPELAELTLQNVTLDASCLSGLQSVQTLDIDNAKLDTTARNSRLPIHILYNFSGTNLRTLCIRFYNLSDLNLWVHLHCLESVYLYYCKGSVVKFLDNLRCPNLELLWVCGLVHEDGVSANQALEEAVAGRARPLKLVCVEMSV